MRALIGIVSRLLVYACFVLLIGDAAVELWRGQNYFWSVMAVIFFPVTIFVWPLTHLSDTVFGLPLWFVFVVSVVAYPISTFVGGLPPITGVPRRDY
ncbi:MAG: hypothetical protein M3R39_06810 [Actinomycetota bacterium]|nr:hypothetical protein [Actinomycetota bacterium]